MLWLKSGGVSFRIAVYGGLSKRLSKHNKHRDPAKLKRAFARLQPIDLEWLKARVFGYGVIARKQERAIRSVSLEVHGISL